MENGLRYKEALQFAMEAHAGAFRKGTNIPYIEHAIETSKIAAMTKISLLRHSCMML